MGKFSKAMGILELNFSGEDLKIVPTLEELQAFKRIVFTHAKNQVLLMEKFEDWMFRLLKRDNPEEKDEDMKAYVALHVIPLFQEVQIAFKFTTREELEKAKQDVAKKLTEDS